MPRPSSNQKQLENAQQGLANLQTDHDKTQELVSAIATRLSDPNSQIRPLLEQQRELTQKLGLLATEMELVETRVSHFQSLLEVEQGDARKKELSALVEQARAIVPEWLERINGRVGQLEEDLQSLHAAVKPANLALIELQAGEPTIKVLLQFGRIQLPSLERGDDGHSHEWVLMQRGIDLDPEATALREAQAIEQQKLRDENHQWRLKADQEREARALAEKEVRVLAEEEARGNVRVRQYNDRVRRFGSGS